MITPKISFRVIHGSGPLTISWFDGPKGDAIESKNGLGVGFFSVDGDLLCVEFDDVDEKSDHQLLNFDKYKVEVTTVRGKITYQLEVLVKKKKLSKAGKNTDEAA